MQLNLVLTVPLRNLLHYSHIISNERHFKMLFNRMVKLYFTLYSSKEFLNAHGSEGWRIILNAVLVSCCYLQKKYNMIITNLLQNSSVMAAFFQATATSRYRFFDVPHAGRPGCSIYSSLLQKLILLLVGPGCCNRGCVGLMSIAYIYCCSLAACLPAKQSSLRNGV